MMVIFSSSFVVWIGPALVCAAAYAFYGSTSRNPTLGASPLQFVKRAAIFGICLSPSCRAGTIQVEVFHVNECVGVFIRWELLVILSFAF
jgi:hypothetical protein